MFSPQALAAMLKGFGIDVDAIKAQVEKITDSGYADKILNAVKTLERVENKLDEILSRLEKSSNGESTTGN